MTSRKQRRAALAKIRGARDRLPPEAKKIADQLIAQNGKASAEKVGNGISVLVRSDKQAIRLVMFLEGKDRTWIEYSTVQLDGLIEYLQTVRAEMTIPTQELN